MSAFELLSALRALDVRVWIEGESLRYSAPKGVLTQELRGRMQQYKTEMLEFLRRVELSPAPALPPIEPVPRDGHLPLSFAQQRLWFLNQLKTENTAYNIPLVWRLTGALNVAALARSFTEILRRHEALRTTFANVNGDAAQQIQPARDFDLRVIDLQGRPEEERRAESQRLASECANAPFDLTTAPLLRALLLRLEPESHLLAIAVDHIACDGWSLAVLFHELSTLYAAYSTGEQSPLPELSVQYADFASWERARLRGELMSSQIDYWKQQLAGAPAVLELPTDRQRPPVQTFNGSVESFQLDAELVERLKALGRQSGATMFALLLAAFKTLLWRYTGQQDIVVGAPTANRRHKEVEPLIGFFANTLMLRTDLSGDPTFRELLERVRRAAVGAFAHQDVPFEKLVEELRPERDPSRNPLVQVLFVLQNAFRPSVSLRGLSIGWESEIRSVRFDLELHIWDTAEGLVGTFMYNTDLFDASTIARMAGHFQTLLHAVAAEPDRRLSRLPFLSEDERRRLLRLSEGEPAEALPACVHHLFEAQVKRTPAAAALTCDEESLSYAELNARANRMARYLRSLGVGAEQTVGVLLERGPALAVALLGILKAGAAYVLLEPGDPEERLAFVLQDARCSVLLSRKALAARPCAYAGRRVCLDSEWDEVAQHGDEDLAGEVSAGSLAALVYTAGLGVELEHRAICRRLSLLQGRFQLSSADVVLQSAATGQDAFVWELFWPLLAGARLHFASDAERNEPDSLRRAVASQKVSVVGFTPAALAAFVEDISADEAELLRTLRAVVCFGEPLRRVTAEKFFQRLSCELHYLYGHAEAPCALVSRVLPATTCGEVLPAGHPAGASVYVLDEHLRLVPEGVAGEIYLGGDGLSRGYWRAPEETARRFVVNPFGEEAGARLFKTGDTGRRRNDASIELLGSVEGLAWTDGYRVALGEVEAAVLAHAAVEDCAVLARASEDGGTRLACYVVAAGPLQPERLRAELEARLPAHMLPCALIPVKTLPLTAAGVVDERALASAEAIDALLIRRWEAALGALPEIEKVAVVAQAQTEHAPPLHLSDLLPEERDAASASAPAAPSKQAGRDSVAERTDAPAPAYSNGGPLTIEADAPQTLPDALVRTASDFAEKGLVYVRPDGTRVSQTYRSLLDEARRFLTGLRESGLRAGDRAILQIPSLRDYFPAFWACLLGGVTPVTVAVSPSYEEENAVVSKLLNAWRLLGRPHVLTTDALAPALAGLKRFLPAEELRVLPVNHWRECPPAEILHRSSPEDVAFIQLSSGSTGVPKCIQITHRGIVQHIHGAREFNSYAAENVSLNWLPMDHVVPILTCHLKDTYLGCQQVAVSTEVVLANPLAWLDLIEEHGVTHTWSPNFGFKLVSDALSKSEGRVWDLSSVEFFMNAGEQVTPPVVREFLERVAPFGVRPAAMQPAFGMAEVCTCMTFQNQFDGETGVHRILKSSLGGPLKPAGRDEAEAIEFIDLGGPVPGVEIRIAGPDNQVLPEGVIGRLQIRGGVTTPGYLNNEAANAEAFVGDGWFNSGDLGFMRDGRLTLTGREKELIIINGANFYCYEIEDVVNQIDGVEPTYVAACGFSDPNTGTEGLALFFSPRSDAVEEHAELVKTIRARVTQHLGISPAQVVPVPKREFPKTTSGKIQRTKLKNLLAEGHFRERLKEIDIRLENANTLPDWFYTKVWRRRQCSPEVVARDRGPYLVFLDRRGLGAFISEDLSGRGQLCIGVEPGPGFERTGAHSFRLAPHDADAYRRLFETLLAEGVEVKQILHLWTYDGVERDAADAPQAIEREQALEREQERGVYSLLLLAQALSKVNEAQRTVALCVVSSDALAVSARDPVAFEKGSMSGLLKTLPQEMPWLTCTHVDLQTESTEMCGARVLRELRTRQGEAQVAYREGTRWVSRLEKIDFTRAAKQALPFKKGGVYLLSGGLGGVGLEVAKYLLRSHQARLLIVGRTRLPERNDWPAHLEREDEVSRRVQAYRSLERLGGELMYRAVDVCDRAGLRRAAEEAAALWGRALDGALHLAGIYEERSLQEETVQSFGDVLRTKALGACAIQELMEDNAEALFISFSSVNGFFGGVRAGAYSAANSFLEAFTDWQRKNGRAHSYCFYWSQWDGLGMSRDSRLKELSRARGYHAVSPAQGMNSFLAGLGHGGAQLFIGLDGGKQQVRRHVAAGPYPAQKLTAYFTARAGTVAPAQLQVLVVRDRFGKTSACDFRQCEEMPLTASGEIDREALSVGGAARLASRTRVLPRTELENQLARVWQDVLGTPRVGVHDSFFELGGHSLLAVRLIFQIRTSLGVEFPLEKLVEAPTVAGMARWIEEQSHAPGSPVVRTPDCLFPLQPAGTKPPFFCVHPAGGSPLCYANLAAHLGAERPFYGFQSPGLLDGSEPLARVQEMAALYVEAMRAVQPEGPYLLGGWSSAGPTIFEMARLLEQQSERVAVLAFFDCGLMESDIPAGRGKGFNPLQLFKVARLFLTLAWHIGVPRSYAQFRGLASFVGISLPVTLGELRRRDFSEKLTFFKRLLSDIRRSARVYRYNTLAGLRYEPATYGGKATLFRAQQSSNGEIDPALEDLRRFAAGGVDRYVVPGNHMSIILGWEESGALVEKLGECLNGI